MVVFVLNKHGEPLMPSNPRKARILLREKKAKIINYRPFTIQLLYGSSGYKQDVVIGIDLGSKHKGIGIQSNNKVLFKGVIELRQDVKSLLDKRRHFRRSRRSRKTRYREIRFLNRKKTKGWLPPSIQSKIDNSFHWIDTFMAVLPNPKLYIENNKFNVQKMINPSIQGIEYQHGDTYGYYDVRYFVFARDNYTCQVCKKQNKILQTHHIVYRSHGGSNRANNLISVCTDCHTPQNHEKNNILWGWMVDQKKTRSYKEGPLMNTLCQRVVTKYPKAFITYGSITAAKRKKLQLEKSHYIDALIIAGIEEGWKDSVGVFKIRQFRKKKRSLHEANARKRKTTKNTESKRYAKNTKEAAGFFLNDTVSVFGIIGFISGFAGGNKFYVKDIATNEYITVPGTKNKKIKSSSLTFIRHNNNWQYFMFF
jgi:5-methylcytosine-specific restriction endonuclease McrA